MGRQEPDLRLLCYASIIALSLAGCSHTGTKPKSGTNTSDSTQSTSSLREKSSHVSESTRNGNRGIRKKNNALVSGSTQYDNLWDRLFDLYDLPPIEHEEIERELSWFINHPDYLERVQERAEPFLYSIVKQVEKHDIPGEIALLPVIESAFQPHAVSPANAAGIWQFIPSTGRIYGLKRSHTYDGRRDIYASTKAAIKYLKKLHRQFDGDWLLAIAGYNCGEGAVERAIEKNMARNLPTDFWSLDLPQETRSYVPRLLAVAKLFVGADQYGIALHDIPNAARFKPVKVDKHLDLALAADAANMPLEKLYALNPGFKGKFADVEGSYHLFIPAEKKAADFRQELARLADESQASLRVSTAIEDGGLDASEASATLSDREPARRLSLASFEPDKSYSPSRAPLYETVAVTREESLPEDKAESRPDEESGTFKARGNRAIRERAPRVVHQRSETKPEPEPQAAIRKRERRVAEVVPIQDKTQERGTKKTSYSVLPGETLWAVARKHAVDVGQLAKWNDFSENTKVQAGQRLVVWNKDAAKKLPPVAVGIRSSQASNYTVREGDTMFSISRRFKVSVADLRKSNGWKTDKQIQAGKNITVPK